MAQVHVIIGEDEYLVSEAAKRIVGDGIGLETVDSANSSNADLQLRDLREAEASLLTPPFLDPKKTTWWRNVGFLPQVKLAAAKLPENQHFILSGPRLMQNSIFAKTLKASVEMAVFSAGKPSEQTRGAVVRAVDFAAEMGLKFAPGAAEAFVAHVGPDSRSLMSELGKMRDYLGPGKNVISESDIAEITSQGAGVEPAVWSITDALGERSVRKALEAVSRFEGESGFSVLVATVAEKFFRQLAELKDAQARGMLGKATESMAPWMARKTEAQLANWSLAELRAAHYRFQELRERAVSSSTADALVVPRIVQACRRRRA